ncbi:NADH dehydrogenase [ubiquinone] 1 alpha subcomplex assembly factor 8 isoform X2 [Ursus americanus]|uniref:NADH dehydrogenase [ubiquinone] 1 alpha subcomplex assembly factor 8 isoform X2 n=1 Tax=Ursus americanus TaxID=9643 RepID=UPI001E67CD6B|nr:NADH dehydrogenase [ubiquinone] 1 alpha subcomplex assembly factor 8 isoform X2 [Ursus americanus]
MSGNGAVWGRVRGRLRAFPERLAACGAEAAAYGRCVQASTTPGGRLTKDLCAQEFEALRSCFAAAVGQEDPEGRPLGWTSQRGTCPREQSQAPGADGPKDKRLKHLRVLELKGQRACQGELWAEGELVFVHRVCVTIWVRVRHNEATIKTMTDHARAPLCCMQSVCWPRSDTLLRILTF